MRFSALLFAGVGTAITMFSLGEADNSPPEMLERATKWLLAKEVRRRGDWSVKRPKAEPAGWYFEFDNEFYPDIDDTAMVLLALAHSRMRDCRAWRGYARAIGWLLAMQSCDGGWAAFDVDNNWEFLNKVPFADHNAMLDPTCPDITGRVLEALVRWGMDPGQAAIQRGIATCCRRRKPTARGSGDGEWTTSTGHSSRCAGCARWATTTVKPKYCAPASGCAPSRTPMEGGARVAPARSEEFCPRIQHALANRLGCARAAGWRGHHQRERVERD